MDYHAISPRDNPFRKQSRTNRFSGALNISREETLTSRLSTLPPSQSPPSKSPPQSPVITTATCDPDNLSSDVEIQNAHQSKTIPKVITPSSSGTSAATTCGSTDLQDEVAKLHEELKIFKQDSDALRIKYDDKLRELSEVQQKAGSEDWSRADVLMASFKKDVISIKYMEENDSLKRLLETQNQRVDELKATVKALEDSLESHKSRLASTSKEKDYLSRAKEDLEKENRRLKEERDRVEAEKHCADKENERLKEQKDHTKNQWSTAMQQRDGALKALKEKEEENEELRRSCKKKEEELQVMCEKRDSLEKEVAEKTQHVNRLECGLHRYRTYFETQNLQLKSDGYEGRRSDGSSGSRRLEAKCLVCDQLTAAFCPRCSQAWCAGCRMADSTCLECGWCIDRTPRR